MDAALAAQIRAMKDQVAARIDRCLSKLPGEDKSVNTEVSEAVGVSTEAVRQWRKGVASPKIENVLAVVAYVRSRDIDTTPEYLLLGLSKGLPAMELRERIVDEGEELELVRLFRASNKKGQETILNNARALQLSFPRGVNVHALHTSKKKKSR